MRMTFVNPALENQGMGILSALLKESGHDVNLVVDYRLFDTEAIQNRLLKKYFDSTNRVIHEILESKPDLIGFSPFSINYQWALRIARLVKKHIKIPIIFGGIHPTILPDVVITNDEVDMVCVGEGERAILELAASIDKGEIRTDIQNIWFNENGKVIKNPLRPLVNNLDQLPFPDKHLFLEKGAFDTYAYRLNSARGCPFHCSFCVNNFFKKLFAGKGKYLRMRSVDSVIKEALWAKKEFSPKVIVFSADVFTTNKAWLREFSPKYKKDVNIPFFALSHTRFMDAEIAQLLKKAGCLEVTIGIESATPEMRKNLLLRPESNEEIIKACRDCKQAGLKLSLDHLINLCGETEQHRIDALRLYSRLRPNSMNVYTLQYYPGTAIVDAGLKAGILNEDTVDQINQGKTFGSMVVGVGGKDSFDPTGAAESFRLLLTLLPFIPRPVVEFIIRRRIYRCRLKPPMILFAVAKILTKIRVHRLYVYRGIITKTLKDARQTLLWKFIKRPRLIKNSKLN